MNRCVSPCRACADGDVLYRPLADMAPKKKGGNAAANMTPEQIAAKRAAAMAMFGGGTSSAAAPKPAAAKPAAAPKAPAAAAAVDVTDAAAEKLAGVDIKAIADDVGSKGLGEDAGSNGDWLSGQHNTPDEKAEEYATALPETWQRLVTVEPMPTMVKNAKKSGTSSAAPHDCKIVEFKNVAYLFDADGKHVTSFRTQLEGANLGTSDKPLVRATKDKHKAVLGKAPNYMKDAIAAHCDVTVTLLPTHHVMVTGGEDATKAAAALIDDLIDADGEVAQKTLAERLAVAEPFCGFLEVVCPDDWVGGIIGKGGKGIKMISDETATTIEWEDAEADESGKPVEGGKPGFFRVKGKFENNCRLAERRIQERLALIQKLDVHTYVMVPRQAVGRLIGKGGSNIKVLQHESGANRITFDKDTGGKANSQQCVILAADVEAALEAGLVILQAVPADTLEAKDVYKARLANYPMQLAALQGGGEADVDTTEEAVRQAHAAKFGVVDKDASGKPNYDKVAAESSKTKPIELAALSFELWQTQWAAVDATVAGFKPKM